MTGGQAEGEAGGGFAGDLPDAVDAAMHALFGRPEGEQAAAFAALCERHPEHEPALSRRWRAVVGAPEAAGIDAPGLARYRIDGLLGRGGMGEVWQAHDLLLDRPIALKRVRGLADAAALRRCRDEARVIARLAHPGIVPVHDLGSDAEGGAWFAMRQVDGESAVALLAAAAGSVAGTTRALTVLQRVCDTMAYAHARGVVHRDLKPANVMVGAFGEVYVVDWGLAKASATAAEGGAVADDPTRTMAGTVLGTPGYLPPERADGAVGTPDPREDVYAVGAMLYQVLTGAVPHAGTSTAESLVRLREGPPPPVRRVVRNAPPALVAICERAMARDPAARYADMRGLAADLGAFLAARSVSAYEVGPWGELRLWVQRNRALAVAIAAALAVAMAALVLVSLSFRDANRSRQRFRSLASVVRLEEAKRRAEGLFPPWPDRLAAFDAWQADYVDSLRHEQTSLRTELERLRVRRGGADGAGATPFADVEDGILFTSLDRHVRELDDVFAPDGLVARLRERREWAATIGVRSIDEPAAAWRAAAEVVAADPRFRGLVLRPQVGLVPIGVDPRSGLPEFVDLRSGALPTRDAAGVLRLAADSGAVFVLLPGGPATVGAQPEDPGGAHHWPHAKPDEGPVLVVDIEPFLLGKHELTQAQWQRLAGYNPSLAVGADTARHPVGHVSWREAFRVLRQEGLSLPTEVQWEYACRAGASTAWATGDASASLQGFANVADRAARDAFGPGFRFEPALDDGFAADAPVGSFAGNAFGLHDLHGNHWEWCLDVYASRRRVPGTGDLEPTDGPPRHRVYRGGSYSVAADNFARCAYRGKAPEDTTLHDLGLRPARALH